MQNILAYADSKNGIFDRKEDVIQRTINSFITNSFFPWLCVIFMIINRKNWKKPVIFVLIIHYILRSSCDFVKGIVDLKATIRLDKHWPYHEKVWYMYGLSIGLSLLGEIIGDWYPLLRTKAVINNNKKMILVYITCIIYNITKIFGIYCYFMKIPFDLSVIDDNGNQIKDKQRFYVYWWTAVLIMQITSFFYDLSVIYALKSCLFNKIKQFNTLRNNDTNFNTNSSHQKQPKNYSFLEKFKQISELRIIISMIASIIFLPFLLIFISILINNLRHGEDPTKMKYNMPIEQFRNVVISINFTFMYIDQILLKSYVAKDYNKNNRSQLSLSSNTKYLNSSQNLNDTFKCDYDPYNSILSPESTITLAYNESELNMSNRKINNNNNDNTNTTNNNSSSNGNISNSNINESYYLMSMINEEPYNSGSNDDSIPIFATSPISPKKSYISNILNNDDFYYSPLSSSPIYQSPTSPSTSKRKSHVADIVINNNDDSFPIYPSSILSPPLSSKIKNYNEDSFLLYSSLSPKKTYLSNIKPYDF